VGKGKRVDVYLEVRKRRGAYIFLNETSACGSLDGIFISCVYPFPLPHFVSIFFAYL
jgi:NADH:ubiquinone oxidoreductase subunit F (NADH-binding)